MDLNLCVIAGRLAATPEVRVFEGGSTVTRLLVTTRQGGEDTGKRRRIDVVPVTAWDIEVPDMQRGDRVWVSGSVQRRFWSDDMSRRSRIEVVAAHVQRGEKFNEIADDGVREPAPYPYDRSEELTE